MNTHPNTAKGTPQNKLDSQVEAARAKVDTLKAQADAARKHAVAKTVDELLARKKALELELHSLKKSGEDKFNQAKASLQAQIANLQNSVNETKSKQKQS